MYETIILTILVSVGWLTFYFGYRLIRIEKAIQESMDMAFESFILEK